MANKFYQGLLFFTSTGKQALHVLIIRIFIS